MAPTPEGKALHILFLHGFTQSGPLFHAKTRALQKSLEKAFPAAPKPGSLPAHPAGVTYSFPTAPIRLTPAQIPGFDVSAADGEETDAWGWWTRKGDTEPFVYEHIEKGLETVARVLKEEGPFDGVVGFSQGGALAGMVASLLEDGREKAFEEAGGMGFPDSFKGLGHPEMKFAVSYSGFGADVDGPYKAFYVPKIRTPTMHFLGSVDTVVEESRSLRLVDACVDARGREGGVQRVVYHPGGHFVPCTQKQVVAALVGFIRECCSGDLGREEKKEESVEDMDVPF